MDTPDVRAGPVPSPPPAAPATVLPGPLALGVVGLWAAVNRHLAHVIAHIEPRALGTPCTVGEGAPVTLRFMAEDYARHLHHHLAQVLNPEAAAGKTHLPYA